MTAIEDANRQQLAASDPAVSAFVSASAGSGKTKLLTDRLLRLMLAGAAPERILCLTYTKAAAAEMRIRLNRRLGEWVTMPEAELRARLRALAVPQSPHTLRRARQLFAEVLDLPGGMRIETIHAFCQSLLRRFPLEARLSPHFTVADDEAAAQRLREAREEILARPALFSQIETVAGEIDELRFAGISAGFAAEAEHELLSLPCTAERVAALLRAALGAAEADDEAVISREFAVPPGEAALRAALAEVAARGTPSWRSWATRALAWLELETEARQAACAAWETVWLTQAGTPRKLEACCGKTAADERILTPFAREAERLLALRDRRKLLRLVRFNAALLQLLIPAGAAERTAKRRAAALTYADLILQTGELLVDPGAAWVLYKLDGGIEHLLLDEVQDTAPAQWRIANAIAAEFFAGEGAREAARSIFAVGDPKQSIFSFQGADLKSFETYRGKFREAARGAGRPWLDGALSVSFRSTAPVLELTDAVFAAGFAREGVLAPGETLRHGVSRAGQAGRVTLWPLTQPEAAAGAPDWDLPDDYQKARSATALLAARLCDFIAGRLGQDLPAKGRPARPGDFLVLVRRRGPLVGALTSRLKARGIAVAGLDRMVLTRQTAVADMLALCDALLLPEDDLAFAQFLVSPLGGLDDDSLMALALGRPASLVAALYARAEERPEWRAAKRFYETLRAQTDFISPFLLLAEALGPLGGRARMLARLGAEAAEPLDELLAEALQFSTAEPGSLQNFVQRVRLAAADIKRESETASDEVRIMTVHGAKGLQAPIVILPDTVSPLKPETSLLWMDVPQQAGMKLPVLCPRAEQRPGVLSQAEAARSAARKEEYNRLLYVALTRAEDELLICGAAGAKAPPATCWYEAVKAGFTRLPARQEDDGSLVYDRPQTAPPDGAGARSARPGAALPGWAGTAPDWRATPPRKENETPERIVPSRAAEGAFHAILPASPLAGPQASASRRAAALARGGAVHALLQHLPGLAPAARREAARAYLLSQPALAAEAEDLCDALLKILGSPELAPLFGPGSMAEVPLAGVVAGRETGGLVDRLFIGAAEIIIADYKTDRAPPAGPDGIPAAYLGQLAAYRAVLRQIHPGRAVRCLLVWTARAEAMPVPDALLDAVALA
ncbi:double-strand break repair helicase AddA [Acidocella sp.]|uniref:double-strand break repair helicase AddA n=1 Tax=Acidocella sp. TaxID=50710 RepID=UPI00260D88E0|nr:double-strand break repair helicase AddA [Acidocella sp.]